MNLKGHIVFWILLLRIWVTRFRSSCFWKFKENDFQKLKYDEKLIKLTEQEEEHIRLGFERPFDEDAILSQGYAQSLFRDFESYLRTGRAPEDEIILILKKILHVLILRRSL